MTVYTVTGGRGYQARLDATLDQLHNLDTLVVPRSVQVNAAILRLWRRRAPTPPTISVLAQDMLDSAGVRVEEVAFDTEEWNRVQQEMKATITSTRGN